MQIAIFHTHYYDHVPAPAGTVVTQADIDRGHAIKVAEDRHLLRVHVKHPHPDGTHTHRGQDEHSICEFLVFAEAFPAGSWAEEWDQTMGRAKVDRAGVATYLTAKQMRQHGRPQHFTKIHVHDDGPVESEFHRAAQRFLDEKHVTQEQVNAWLALYLADKTDVAKYMTDFFEIGA